MHLDPPESHALAAGAAAARSVEAEPPRVVSAQAGGLLGGEYLANEGKTLDVRDRVRARRGADRALIDEKHAIELPPDIASLEPETARRERVPRYDGIENVDDEAALAGAGDPRHARDETERKAHVDVLEVVLGDSLELDRAVVPALLFRHGRARPPAKEPFERFRFRGVRRARLLDRAAEEDLSAEAARTRAEVHEVIARADDIGIVLDDENGVAEIPEPPEHRDEPLVVGGVKPDRRLVEDVERVDEIRAEGVREIDALRLPPESVRVSLSRVI